MRLPSNEGEIHTNNMQCENAEDNFDENEDDTLNSILMLKLTSCLNMIIRRGCNINA